MKKKKVYFTKREMIMFLWLKCGKDEEKVYTELANSSIALDPVTHKMTAPSKLELKIRKNPEYVRQYLKERKVQMKAWYVAGDNGYSFPKFGRLCMPKCLVNYIVKKENKTIMNDPKKVEELKNLANKV